MNIRPAHEADHPAILHVLLSAFGEAHGQEIAGLVHDLLQDETAAPLLSLVAEADQEILGHILFSRATLTPGHEGVSVALLAPLAVSEGHQGKGVGRALIREGSRLLAAAEVDLVLVLGHPDYYAQHGFRPAGALGLEAPYPIPAEHAEAWMVRALRPGVIGTVQGRVQCARTLDQPRYWRE